MFGSEDRVHTHNRGSEQTFHYARGHDADFTAEELFNMFFGANFPMNSNVHMRRNARVFRQTDNTNTHNRAENNSGVILQLVPVLFLILLSMMSSYFVADPIFSLHQSRYVILKKNINLS